MSSPLIDAHAHVWSQDRVTYPMVSGRERDPKIDGSAERLLGLMKDEGVSSALLVQAPWYGTDERYFQSVLERYPGRFVALACLVEPFAADAGEGIRRRYHQLGYRGARIHLNRPGAQEGVLEGRADEAMRTCRDLGVPVQFLTPGGETCPAVSQSAQRFPDLKVVIDHLAHPRVQEGYPYPSSAPFFACAKLLNVYVKASMQYLFSDQGYPWANLSEFQQMTLEAFGAKRLMWGSNYPMELDQVTYHERLACVRDELTFLSDTERNWILGETSLQVWPDLRPKEA